MLKPTPEKIAEGLRDYIAWEHRAVADVEVRTRASGRSCEVQVSVHQGDGKTAPDALEQDIKAMLPAGYSLTMNWKEEEHHDYPKRGIFGTRRRRRRH